MPLYEYQCSACGTVTDVRHGFDETPALSCEKCQGALARRFNPAGIVFKGSGFYVNDNRAASAAGASSGESKSEATPAKTESAPAKSEPAA